MYKNIKIYTAKGSNLTSKNICDYKELASQYTKRFYQKVSRQEHQADCFQAINELFLERFDCSIYLTEMWSEHLEKIKSEFYKNPFELLTHDMVRYAIYLTTANAYLKLELDFLKKHYEEDELKRLLVELPSYLHTITEAHYHTSESRSHHLSHLTYAQSKFNCNISEMPLIVEFGGGYGGMTSLLKLLNAENTIVVIDLPTMLNIQYYYLYPDFKALINVINSDEDSIVEGKINLCPINLVKAMGIDSPDLFIATWSLSEANEYTQTLIVDELELFNAKHILYGYRKYEKVNPRQPCSNSLPLNETYDLLEDKATFWALEKESNYLLAKRND